MKNQSRSNQNWVRSICDSLSRKANAIAINSQKGCLIVFALLSTALGILLVGRGLSAVERSDYVSISQIKMAKDIYMKDQGSDDRLIMVGKLKGEIEGEFQSFYLAVDRHGEIYINHNLSLNEHQSLRSAGWERINREQLMDYEKHLHFLPLQGKSITH